jgi:hypothetical protein
MNTIFGQPNVWFGRGYEQRLAYMEYSIAYDLSDNTVFSCQTAFGLFLERVSGSNGW